MVEKAFTSFSPRLCFTVGPPCIAAAAAKEVSNVPLLPPLHSFSWQPRRRRRWHVTPCLDTGDVSPPPPFPGGGTTIHVVHTLADKESQGRSTKSRAKMEKGHKMYAVVYKLRTIDRRSHCKQSTWKNKRYHLMVDTMNPSSNPVLR